MVEIEKLLKIIKNANELAKHLSTSAFLTYKKEDDSPVTTVDLETNKFLIDNLKKHYRDIPILSEETADDIARLESKELFIIDPIDGTTELFHPNREFAINLAYVVDQQVVYGLIGIPCYDLIYYAIKDHGAFKISGEQVQPIHVSDRLKGEWHLALSRSHKTELDESIASDPGFYVIKNIGSSFKLCLLAEGTIDIAFKTNPGTKEWDVAPADLIIKEAGGQFGSIEGENYSYNKPDPHHYKGYLASNSRESSREFIQIYHLKQEKK
jgi:3'(2'), 5'-bisphosphate nucleotidase